MRLFLPVVLLVVLSAYGPYTGAQTPPPAFELSPFVGYMFGGRVAPSPGPDPGDPGSQRLRDRAFGGVRTAVFPSRTFGVELELSRVTSAVAVRNLPCGQGGPDCDYGAALDYVLALTVVRGTGRVQPYAELGGGIGRLTTLFGRRGSSGSVNRGTASAAIGVDIAVSEHLGLRLDARGYAIDIGGLDVGPPCTTSQTSPGGPVNPVPCRQDRWLRNAALSAGMVFRL